MVKIRYYGHSMWEVSNKDHRIILDPFEDIGYPMPKGLEADIVCSSHQHFDHNNFSLINSDFHKINQAGHYTFNHLHIEMIETYHDHEQGKKRGINLLCRIVIDDIIILHCGDLGHIPSKESINNLLPVDILMIPVGGTYTINSTEARELCNLIQPKLIFPMHYKTHFTNINISSPEEFIDAFEDVIRLNESSIELEKSSLNKQQIVMFEVSRGE